MKYETLETISKIVISTALLIITQVIITNHYEPTIKISATYLILFIMLIVWIANTYNKNKQEVKG